MRNIKKLQKWIPELYLMASVIYYWIMTGTLLNPVAVGLLLVLTILMVRKSEILGVIISLLFLVLNLYMVLALTDELKEFPTFNKRAQELLFFGLSYLGLNMLLSAIMLIKWGSMTSSTPTTKSAEPI